MGQRQDAERVQGGTVMLSETVGEYVSNNKRVLQNKRDRILNTSDIMSKWLCGNMTIIHIQY